jgi:nucleotide-binding universal stress UspA family protein
MESRDEPIRKILVPIDGSEGSSLALEKALALARALSAEVIGLEVIEDEGPLPTKHEAPPSGRTRTDWLAEERFEKARELLARASAPFRRRVEEGYPADVICQVAEAEGADLVVMGSRGLGPVARFLIGSVSDKVVRHAPCSVLVVR